MAVSFASVQTQNNLGSDVGQITITKPVSLAVGDLMIAHIVYGRGAVLTPLTGWKNLAGTVDAVSELDQGVGGNYKSAVQWKIADSSDVAASNFTWVVTVDTTIRMAGAIYRIVESVAFQNPIGAWGGTVVLDSATPSHANGITPVVANSLLLMLGSSNGITSVSGYAIATSNPTWTERVDIVGDIFGATATRPEITNTGNSTFTLNGGTGTTDSTCFLIAVSPYVSVPYSLSVSTHLISLTGIATTLSAAFHIVVSFASYVYSGFTAVFSVARNSWTPRERDTTDNWVNRNKS